MGDGKRPRGPSCSKHSSLTNCLMIVTLASLTSVALGGFDLGASAGHFMTHGSLSLLNRCFLWDGFFLCHAETSRCFHWLALLSLTNASPTMMSSKCLVIFITAEEPMARGKAGRRAFLFLLFVLSDHRPSDAMSSIFGLSFLSVSFASLS